MNGEIRHFGVYHVGGLWCEFIETKFDLIGCDVFFNMILAAEYRGVAWVLSVEVPQRENIPRVSSDAG